MATRRAIYLPDTGRLEVITQTEIYVPTGSQSLVKVAYSAINPADLRHYYMGWNSYVAGYEWIGTVEAVGPDSPYKLGEVLFGFAKPGHKRPITAGAHQDYILAETFMTYRYPVGSGLDWKQVVSWPTGLLTVVDALFNCMGFAFPPLAKEGITGQDPKGRAILIWGGASTLGLFAIQLARFLGFSPILTTASAHNHATLLRLGATQCFDYRLPTVVDDIRAASKKPLTTVFDAVGAGMGFGEPEPKANVDLSTCSPELARRCVTDEKGDDVRLCCALPVEHDPRWGFCFPIREADTETEYARRLAGVVDWLLEHRGEVGYEVPRVRVVKGAEEGIRAIHDVFEGRTSMEKVVIEHPL
ncbi:hypothetical protein F4810DRAFT_337158 [Camillea tinctor]|nr:hypothetical protein F4810DRAFT_337158 [Camillea tinctor]